LIKFTEIKEELLFNMDHKQLNQVQYNKGNCNVIIIDAGWGWQEETEHRLSPVWLKAEEVFGGPSQPLITMLPSISSTQEAVSSNAYSLPHG
jgi:hypothetical protein